MIYHVNYGQDSCGHISRDKKVFSLTEPVRFMICSQKKPLREHGNFLSGKITRPIYSHIFIDLTLLNLAQNLTNPITKMNIFNLHMSILYLNIISDFPP